MSILPSSIFLEPHISRPPDQGAIITLSGRWALEQELTPGQMDLMLIPHPVLPVADNACSPALVEGIQSRLDQYGYVLVNNLPLLPPACFEPQAARNRKLLDEFQKNGHLKESRAAVKAGGNSTWDKELFVQGMQDRLLYLPETILFSAEEMQREEAGSLLCVLVSGFAQPIKNEEGNYVSIIRPSPDALPGEISSRTNGEFTTHTDLTYWKNPPQYVVLFNIENDPFRHAQNQFAALDEALTYLDAQTIDALLAPEFDFSYPKRGGIHANKSGFITAPVLTQDAQGGYHVRYRHDVITAKTSEGQAALGRLQEAFNKVRVGYTPQVGTVMIARNDKITHARTGFFGDRCVLRVFANDP